MKVIMGRDLRQANNNRARENRELFTSHGITVINLVSSPGSGKTALLEQTAPNLAGYNTGVIVGDLYTERDAARLERAGARAIQVNTGGICHLDSGMVARAAAELELDTLDLLFIENVGNLVCPVAFDLGEQARVVVLSVTEGADKPAKYPGIFREASAAVINKTDLLPYLDFDLDTCTGEIKKLNAGARIFATSARTGEGIEEWCSWLQQLAGANRG